MDLRGVPFDYAPDTQTFVIIGAAMEVHRHLGCGFLEPVYKRALAMELRERQVPFATEVSLPARYKGRPLGLFYRADFICFENIVVEAKALSLISGREQAQVLNYLRLSNHRRALLLNFGARSLQFKRIVL